MIRWVVLALAMVGVFPALGEDKSNAPATLPKRDNAVNALQVHGVDAELSVNVDPATQSLSLRDELNSAGSSLSPQKAQILLRHNILDDVSLTYQNKVGIASVAPPVNGEMTAQRAQSLSRTEVRWNASDDWSVATSTQTDQIFEFQRSQPSHTRQGLESNYQFSPNTSLGLGAYSENFYNAETVSLERETTLGQARQKIGSLPLYWSGSPSLITENAPLDFSQNRNGTRLDQSLLWNISNDMSLNVGAARTDWDYTSVDRQQAARNLYSQWTRQALKRLKITFRTDLETNENRYQAQDPTLEDKFRLSLGQQLSLDEDFSAAFDLRQEYQRGIDRTWSPADHSATFSIQRKF